MPELSSSGDDTAVFTLAIQNEASDVVRLSNWLNQTVAPTLKLSPKLTFRLDLILEEALTNVINYAYPTQGAYPIHVTLMADTNSVSVQVVDEGRPFNPLAEHEVNLPTTLEDAGDGGLGLHLIRSYAQTCHYQRRDGQNIFTMIFERLVTEP